jgi:hypothetical protein
MLRRTLEKTRERERKLHGSRFLRLTDAGGCRQGVGRGGHTCTELPVWNAHQTNMAEKDTASLCDDMRLSDRDRRVDTSEERRTSTLS